MSDTVVIARIMGVFALLNGCSMLLRRRMLVSIFHELARSRTLSYVIGMLMTLMGLSVIATRATSWHALDKTIALIGWLVFLEGASYLFLSKKSVAWIIRALDRPFAYYIVGFGYIILGGYLTVMTR